MPDGRAGKCEQNSGDDNGNPEKEKASDYEKCDARNQAKKHHTEYDRRRTRLRDNNSSHAVVLVDPHPESRRLAPGTLIDPPVG
jgi:hypothetical protein